MQTISLKQLFKLRAITNISVLRTNENDYPYVTLLNGAKAYNIYFDKKTSAPAILSNFEIGDSILSELVNASVILVANEDGEDRYKLMLNTPESQYASQSELESLFGLEMAEGDFAIEDFTALFQAKPSVTAKPTATKKTANKKA